MLLILTAATLAALAGAARAARDVHAADRARAAEILARTQLRAPRRWLP